MSKRDEEEIRESKKLAGYTKHHILILGADDVGKNTIFKQWQYAVAKKVFTEMDIKHFKGTIIANMLEAMYDLVTVAKKQKKTSIRKKYSFAVERILSVKKDEFSFLQSYEAFPEGSIQDMKLLWQDEAIQKTFRTVNQLSLNGPIQYFFNEIDRIGSPDYQPVLTDIWYAKKKNTGISEYEFIYDGHDYGLILTPGLSTTQHAKKWQNKAQDVSVMLFVCSVSDFFLPSKLENYSKYEEQLSHFSNLLANHLNYFRNSHIFVVLNKIDIFKQILKTRSFSTIDSNCTDGKNFEKSLAFVSQRFRSIGVKAKKKVAIHQVTAINSDSVKKIFSEIDDRIKSSIAAKIIEEELDTKNRWLDLGGLRAPSEIYLMDKLTDLNVSSCNIEIIPPAVGKLQKLISLNLSHNKLISLPIEIANLDKLKSLELGYNLFVDLPRSLEPMKWIISLNISANNIANLPSWLGNWDSLEHLLLTSNPIKNPPEEIIVKGVSELKAFLRELEVDEIASYRTKLMFVGQENVGKTTLNNCLHKIAASKKIRTKEVTKNLSTVGIDIDKLILHTKSDKQLELTEKYTINCSTWDFGGQEIYYTTHSFFLSRRSIYLLVWDLRKELEDSRVAYWLGSIKSRAPDSAIIIVGTHSDDKRVTRQKIEEATQQIKTAFGSTHKNIKEIVACSNLKPKSVKDLLTKISLVALDQPHMGERLPTSYATLESIIEGNKNEFSPPVLSWQQYIEFLTKKGVEMDEDQITRATSLLHDLGVLVYFNDQVSDLKDMVILNPEYLTSVFSSIINTQNTWIKNGILHIKDLVHIWNSEQFPVHLHQKLISLFIKFEIAFQFPLEDGEEDVWDNRSVLLVCLLPLTKPDLHILWKEDSVETSFSRIYLLEFLPYGLFSRIIVRLLYFGDPLCYWQNGLIISYKAGSRAFVELHPQDKKIEVYVRGPNSSHLLRMITELIEIYCASWFIIRTKQFIVCPHCMSIRAENPTLFSLKECEIAATEGINYLICKEVCTVRLDKVVPDIAMVDIKEAKIDYSSITINEEIGRGAFGIIHKALWRGEVVAVKEFKVFDQEGLAEEDIRKAFTDFRHEVWLMSGLKHINVVNLKGFCLEPLCMVMEFIEHGDLYQYLANPTNILEWPMRLKIAVDIASGMKFLHSVTPPVLHKDLKSLNILLADIDLEAPTVAKVADFGVSTRMFIDSLKENSSNKRLITNPTWLAPEVLSGEEYSHASDVYSFSIILWELYFRMDPFAEYEYKYMWQQEDAIKEGIRPSIHDDNIDPMYKKLIIDCWNPVANERPTYDKVLSSLLEIVKSIAPEILDSFNEDIKNYQEKPLSKIESIES